MTWVAWRQQRTESLLGAALLVLVALFLVPTGIEIASAYHRDHIAACQDGGFLCQQAITSFRLHYGTLQGLSGWLTVLPGLAGVMLAAPFVLQLEHGTHRLDWTQSVTRGRWIVVKLGLAVASTVIFSAILVSLVTWWRQPFNRLDGRMQQSAFDTQGLVVFGYTLFALGLGLAIGVLWRRAVAGLVVAFIGYFIARLFVDNWLRQRLISPESLTWPARKLQPAVLDHAWVINMYPSDRAGHSLDFSTLCTNPGPTLKACVTPGAQYFHAVYEPAGRFWTMQIAELGLFAGVALVLIAFAAWWTKARAV